MQLRFTRLTLKKKHPLQISRGTSSDAENLFVEVMDDQHVGLGEMAPIAYDRQNAEGAEIDLRDLADKLVDVRPYQISAVEKAAKETSSTARAALINACYDWTGRASGMPVHVLLGLEPTEHRTSITVGINPVERIRELVPELIREVGTDELKLKLGRREGIDADKEAFCTAKEVAPPGTKIRVDANGGWSIPDAIKMVKWLAQNGAGYVEQPLGFEDERGLFELKAIREIPIFVDEYVRDSMDVARLAGACDGVNIKLMKCGGIAEAMRCVATARAHGLKTMIGCFGESSVSISAGAAIGGLFDYIDLDSHLNLDPDPAEGCSLQDGRIVPCDVPGLGVDLL
ncbi:MAG: dipeptide epimerase [Armatimonadetes bacterium]|nr:dipeptide epimerase [Armatimonadota bacterium]